MPASQDRVKHCRDTATHPPVLGDVLTDPSLPWDRCFYVIGRELLPSVLSMLDAQASLLEPDRAGMTGVCMLQGAFVYFIHHMLLVGQEGSCCIAWAALMGPAPSPIDSVNAPHPV